MRKRRGFENLEDSLEATQFRNNTTPLAKCVSGQRLQLVRHQEDAMLIPYDAESPRMESTMIQEIYCKSSSIQPLRGKIKVLAKFSYQDLDMYFYHGSDGIVHILEDTKYFINNGFANRMNTDLKDLEVGVEYDINSDEDNFLVKYPSVYDPVSNTVGYGANVNCVISTVRANALDAIDVSENFVQKFACLRDKQIRINLDGKTIISRYPNIFPELGELVEDTMLFKIVKNDTTVAYLAQNPQIPSGYEDEAIILEPLTYINRIEVYCNNPIENPILEEYRLSLLKFRADVYEFIESLPVGSYDDFVDNWRGEFRTSLLINGTQEIEDPFIIMYTKTISIAETESKFIVDPVHGNMCLKSVLKAGIA